MTETDIETPDDSTDWRHVSGPAYEGMVIPTEGFSTSLGSTEGPPPTDIEVQKFEALIEDEIKESRTETVAGLEELTDWKTTYQALRI